MKKSLSKAEVHFAPFWFSSITPWLENSDNSRLSLKLWWRPIGSIIHYWYYEGTAISWFMMSILQGAPVFYCAYKGWRPLDESAILVVECRCLIMSRRASVFARNNPGKRRVRFPDEVIFENEIKEQDGSAVMSMLRRASIDIDINRINSAGEFWLGWLFFDGISMANCRHDSTASGRTGQQLSSS